MIADRADGMLETELALIKNLAKTIKANKVLEIGLANGSSSIAILQEITCHGNATLTSIDPFQNHPSDKGLISGYNGQGLKNIQSAGFEGNHRFIEKPSYLGMAELVENKEKFDLILIDGYHSFDYTFVDYFFADLLLNDQGLLLIHDTNMPSIAPVCSFIEKDKNYQKISPMVIQDLNSFFSRVARRIRLFLQGNYSEFLDRKNNWGTLVAYKKLSTTLAAEKSLNGIQSA